MTDPLVIDEDHVARRLVMPRELWDRICDLAESMRGEGKDVSSAELATSLLEVGLGEFRKARS